MPTRLHQAFPPDFTGTPTAMAPNDRRLWHSWYPTLDPKPDRLYFNVGVGSGRPPPQDVSPADRDYWLQVTQKRIDALLLFPDHLAIVELRAQASPNAVGRLLTYRKLLHEDNPFAVPIEAWLVTDYPDPDLPAITRAARIRYIVWPR